MATNAFQAGFNLNSQRNNDTNTGAGAGKSNARKATGGIPGMIGGAIQKSRGKSSLKKAQKGPGGLQTAQSPLTDMIPSAKRGGKVIKTGLLHVHRGETIVPAGKGRVKKTSRKRTVIKP